MAAAQTKLLGLTWRPGVAVCRTLLTLVWLCMLWADVLCELPEKQWDIHRDVRRHKGHAMTVTSLRGRPVAPNFRSEGLWEDLRQLGIADPEDSLPDFSADVTEDRDEPPTEAEPEDRTEEEGLRPDDEESLIHELEKDVITDNVTSEEVTLGVNYMLEFGYLPKDVVNSTQASVVKKRGKRMVAEAVRSVQKSYGLLATGILNPATLAAIRKPRCGVPDVLARYALSGTKWSKNDLTYRLESLTPHLTEKEVREAIANAFRVWSDYTPLTFTSVASGRADIIIKFSSGDHQDGSPFDGRFDFHSGRGLRLAHAFQPPRDSNTYYIDGDTHFDADELWTLNTPEGTNLFQVAVHEFGHALGLSHTPVPGTIMFPAYIYKDNPCMHPDDKMAIQSLYGQDEKPDPIIPECSPLPDRCRRPEFDAVFQFRGELFFLKDVYFFRINQRNNRVSGPDPITHFWSGLPNRVDAAYERIHDGKLIFFSGNLFWLFEGVLPEPGYPQPISRFGLPVDSVDAALPWRPSGKTYFFKDEYYWRYDEHKGEIDPGFPRPITVWRGLPTHIDAAFEATEDGHVYVFKGQHYWKYSETRYRVVRGYPRETSDGWMGC
ncbi:interstitial collagenase-like isoform X1 [Branchiostoma floridae x Branchiostoma belcheri]